MMLDKIEADVLLLVEGKDEKDIFSLLLDQIKPGWSAQIDIQSVDGKAGLLPGAQAIPVVSGFDRLKKLAVMVDADNDPDRTDTLWAIEKKRFTENHSPKEFHYLVLPGVQHKGALESVFLQSLDESDLHFKCVTDLMACLSGHAGAQTQAQKDKFALITYINTQVKTPYSRVGFAMTKDAKTLFDFKRPAFQRLVDFLKSLF